MFRSFKSVMPKVAPNCFIAQNSTLVGDIEIGEGSSVWFGAVIRADMAPIRIGKNVNIQDNCAMHVSVDRPTKIGDNVSVGHGAILHSTEIKGDCIIGMGAILLTGSKIGKNCIIGAGSVVTEDTEIPDNSIVMGIPAKVVKQTTEEHTKRIKKGIEEYRTLANAYMNR